MTGLEQLGQLAGTLSPGGVIGWLSLACVLVLLVSGLGVLGSGIATARRTRRRGGRQAPGPPPGRSLSVADEAREFAAITRQARSDVDGRLAARVIGPVHGRARRTRTKARAARR